MQSLVKAATDLPVIVQGALGSALFALALFLGQKASKKLAQQVSNFSRARRLNYLTDEIAKLHFAKGKTFALKGAFVSLLILRSLRSISKAFIWLTLGMLFGSFGTGFGVAGFIGALYYFFDGLNTLRPPQKSDDISARLKELSSERRKLRGEA